MRLISGRVRKREVLMVAAVLVVLVSILPVIGAQERVSPELTATRDIRPVAGSVFDVALTLNVIPDASQKISRLELDETIPAGWIVTRADHAGAIFDASESELRWTWLSADAEEDRTITYEIQVPPNTTEGSYPISGKVSGVNVTGTSVGGDLAVTVTSPTPKSLPAAWVVGAAFVLMSATFWGLILLGWLKDKDHKLDKGEMRRAIAGTFVVGFIILTISSCTGFDIFQKEIVQAYTQLTFIVVGFYFGARTAVTSG
ncbi:MAG: hypothetical protein GWP10_12835 [Nitrospiraceae bacterium]|nr:hypothetical protein [Nitrospiraceae bacterium]